MLTAEGGATLGVGRECVVMEQAVLRASGRFSLSLGDHVLVGPHAYLSGCTVSHGCFVATGAMVFNGATLGEATTVALGAKVHIDSELPAGAYVPMAFIASGRPATVRPPDQAPEVHAELAEPGSTDG